MEVSEYIKSAFRRLSKLSTFVEFQTELVNCVREETGDVEGFLQEFLSLGSSVEKVNFLYDRVQRYDLLKEKFTPDKKDDWKANRHKRKGDNAFANNDFIKALNHFTRLIMKSESQELAAKGYANRSAALFKLGLFAECLVDIDRAIENGYPQEQMRSLTLRKTKATDNLRISPQKRFHEEVPVIPHDNINPQTPCSSRSVGIVTHSGRRRIFAKKDISVGEVLVIEPPFAFTVSGLDLYHCDHCLNLCYNPIPCQHCCQVIYCGESCRDQARGLYHEDECPLLITLKNIVGKHKSFLLALKMTLLSQRNVADEASKEIMGELIGNMGAENNDETFTLALVTALMFHLVKNYVQKFAHTPDLDEDFKRELMVNLRVCGAYAAGIDELVPNITEEGQIEDVELMKYKSESVGCGVYPFYSLISHSCWVNAVVHHHGTTRVIRAVRSIKKDREVFISFGPFYTKHDKEERQQRLLSQYHFTCTCKACTEDWPQLDLMPYIVKNPNDLSVINSVRTGSVVVAKWAIPRFISVIQRFEHLEPHMDLILYHKMLCYCYDFLGNTRRIH